MKPVFAADVKTRCFHFLLHQLRFWSFLLSSVSWQSHFLVFLESRALCPVTYKKIKPTVLVSVCFPNNLPISGLKQHIFISLLFSSLDVQQGSHWAGIKASAGPHHFCSSRGESVSCLFKLLETTYIPSFTAPFIHYQTSNAAGLQPLSRITSLFVAGAKKSIPHLRIVGLRM